MGEILITFVKQSTAYKLMRAADKSGIYAKMVQTPKELSQGGCSYGVVMRRSDMSRAVKLCREYSIEYRKIFALFTDLNGKKIYSQI